MSQHTVIGWKGYIPTILLLECEGRISLLCLHTLFELKEVRLLSWIWKVFHVSMSSGFPYA